MQGGAFPHIRLRPFDLIADPKYPPRDIFVAAIESLPFNPSAEMQVEGHEDLFKKGLEALSKLTTGRVHLLAERELFQKLFRKPIASQNIQSKDLIRSQPSLHIQHIAPIKSSHDYVWTLST